MTIFLSNDATAVVLTPAVAAAVKTAKVKDPLPYLFVCAFIANAASFVLPISNPANLVIYGSHMPPLLQWLPRFAAALRRCRSSRPIAVLRLTQNARALPTTRSTRRCRDPGPVGAGKLAAAGIGLTAVALLASSAFDIAARPADGDLRRPHRRSRC